MIEYLKILGLDEYATQEDIKQAYRRLAQKHHPDRNPDDPDAAARFRQIREAFEALKAGHKPRKTKKKKAADAAAEQAQERRQQWQSSTTCWDEAYAIYRKSVQTVFTQKVRLYRALRGRVISPDSYSRSINALGAYAAQQSKLAKRHFIIEMLIQAKNQGFENIGFAISGTMPVDPAAIIPKLDITPTLANNFAKQLIGRGLEKPVLNAIFGTPGRTAADKTKTTVHDLENLMTACKQGLSDLEFRVHELREHYRVLYDIAKRDEE